jgi:DNA invertase Pin-like site-specific DNA recombinase
MALSREEQLLLRRYFDNGQSKRLTARETRISEATVYRYFVRWEALKRDVIDLEDVPQSVMDELTIQAGMRCMKPY